MSSPARVILSVVTKDGTALIYIAENGALKLEFTGSIAMELSDPVLISKLTEAFDRHRSTQDTRQMTFPFRMEYKPCCAYGGSISHNGHEYCTTCGEQLK